MHRSKILLLSQVVTQSRLRQLGIKVNDFTKTVGYIVIYEAPTGLLDCKSVFYTYIGSYLTLLPPATPLATLDITSNACILDDATGVLYVNVDDVPAGDVIIYY